MTLEDKIKENAKPHDITLEDLGYKKESDKSLTERVMDVTGVTGIKDFVKDYYVNFYKGLFKGMPRKTQVKNWFGNWGSGIASYAYLFTPVKEKLQSIFASKLGAYGTWVGNSYEVLGGSTASQLAASAVPYLFTTAPGIMAMYYGLKKKNPYITGAGAAFAFAPGVDAAANIFPYIASLLGGAPWYVTAGITALAAGAIYKAGQAIARPVVEYFYKKKEKSPKISPDYSKAA